MCVVIELGLEDDRISTWHRLGRLGPGDKRVVLVLPWDLRYLSRDLDYDLLRRETERHCREVAIVAADPERRQLAIGCGFPAFPTVGQARRAADWAAREVVPVEPAPRYWWEEESDLQPQPARPRAPWFDWARLGVRLAAFAMSFVVVAVTAYLILPSASVTLVPAGDVFTVIVPVSADLDAEGVDHASGVIPARRLGVYVEGRLETETTGKMRIYAGRPTGDVIFTNLLSQDYVVPAGTIVRTSSTSYPIRFRTTEEVSVPAGGQATVAIEAAEDRVGNVSAFQINRVEGIAGSAVRVINPRSTLGAEPREVRVVSPEDYERAWSELAAELLDRAYVEMMHLEDLGPTEFVLRHSLLIEAVPKRAYDRFVTEQANTLVLNMRLLVSGWAVDADNAEVLAYGALSRRLPSGYDLLYADFDLGEEAEEDVGPGSHTFFVTVRAYADAALDPDTVISLVRGQSPQVARQRLVDSLPLAGEPQISVWPDWPRLLGWLERMPLIPLRIAVHVVPQSRSSGLGG
jgi:hypothetical protein